MDNLDLTVNYLVKKEKKILLEHLRNISLKRYKKYKLTYLKDIDIYFFGDSKNGYALKGEKLINDAFDIMGLTSEKIQYIVEFEDKLIKKYLLNYGFFLCSEYLNEKEGFIYRYGNKIFNVCEL